MPATYKNNAVLFVKKIPSPYIVFLGIYLLFYYAPVLYLAFTGGGPNLCENNSYLIVPSIFLISYLLPALLAYKRALSIRLDYSSSGVDRIHSKLYRFVAFVIVCSAAYVFFYAFFSGLNKIVMLGNEMDPETFRLAGYQDEYRMLQMILELTRRVLLPLASVYAASAYYFGRAKRDKVLFVLALVALSLGSTLTLDRAPVLLAIVTLMYCLYIYAATSLKFIFLYMPVFLLVLPVIGAVVTMLQHNIVDFDLPLILNQAVAVAVNRIWMDPIIMSCQDAFNLFDGWNNCLLLKYSRITSLITGEYVGTFSDNALYITPVGIVGDIWRNFGYIGMLILPTLLGGALLRIGTLMRRQHPTLNCVILFVSIEFSFYVNYGNLFTYGAAILFLAIWLMTSKKFRALPV